MAPNLTASPLNDMKTLVIYDSAFGNTQAMAEAMAKALKAEISHVNNVKPETLPKYELLIFGSPIQGWQPLPGMATLLASIPKGFLNGTKAAAFDTRVSLFIHGDAVQKMAEALRAAGANVVATEFFYVKGSKGPFKKGEMERAVAWVNKIK